MPYGSLREFIDRLEAKGRLVRITAPVSPYLDMTEIQTRLLAEQGPAVLFENPVRPDGTPYGTPVLINLFGTVERVAWGMDREPDQLRQVGETLAFLKQPEPPGGLKEALELLPLAKTVLAMKSKAQVAVDIMVRNLFERTADIGFLAMDDDVRAYLSRFAPLKSRVIGEEARLERERADASLLIQFREYVQKYSVYANIILLDVRPEAEVANGHIPRAVNIPLAAMVDAEEDFPVKAPVVVYGNGDEAGQAYKMLSKWGLKTVALVEGGLEGYVSRGHQLTKDKAESEITWVRQLGKTEVAAAEFLEAAKSGTAVILDVRTPDETASGKFENALTIPLDTLEAKIAELPKDKEILVHCSTGARAEMAQQLLTKNGLKARFLMADVTCESVGSCTVE